MEWLLVNPHIHNIFASLGCQVGDQYVAHPNCQVTLDHIMEKLRQEDRTLRTFRRAIVFSNLIKKDLMQLLIAIKDNRVIIDKTVKLFAELTTPVESLLLVDVMSKTDAGRTTIIELNWLLYSAKESFLEPKATRRVVDIIRMLLDEGVEQNSPNEETLTDCISLLRNILHVPESRPTSKGNSTSYQNRLIWNLFSQNFDKVLINLAARKQSGKWKIGVVQLIVLLYKDQQETVLQKLLNQWLEATMISDSSEDNESNTSPPEHYSSSSGDPTSDSSDTSMTDMNGVSEQHKTTKCSASHKKLPGSSRKTSNRGNSTKKIETNDREAKHQERSKYYSLKTPDSGCDTSGGTPESASTSSNDESPERKAKLVHQKPGNMIQKPRQVSTKKMLSPEQLRELKMKKLHRRALNHSSLSTGSIHYAISLNLQQHNPTDEDISQILKEFTVDFLISAYACIVEELRRQLVDNRDDFIDSSHFSWLITYFLKFAIQLELDFESIRPVLSRDAVTFLVYNGVFLCEQHENSHLHSDFDMPSRLRKLHLIVTAIREVLLALNSYLNASYVTKESKQLLSQLQSELCGMEDLRNLIVMMLRQFNPNVHCRSYLIDLICTNHILIDTVDKCKSLKGTDVLINHLKQFTAIDMMKQYGHLLEFYQENGPDINDCIFNMMHHVAGDLDSLSSLFQPSIIKSFTLIYENSSQLLDDWTDLIEYVIHQFIESTKSVKTDEKPKNNADVNRAWTSQECDPLFWYFVQSANSSDPIGSILQLYSDGGAQNRTRIGLIEQLLKQDIICDTQFNELMAKEPIGAVERERANVNVQEEVEYLKGQLLNEGMESLITWLQKELLKACHAKLSLVQETEGVVEPSPFYYAIKHEAMPIIPWNCEQYSAMQNHVFLLFLHKLGFALPADTGYSFARIPKTWTLAKMFNLALKLGPVPEGWIKFDATQLRNQENNGTEDRSN
uniref:Protein timeless n=1 Tax=Lygus hesperus TaxID=30085 RepID=A0A0A9W4L0_LYGHE